MFAFHYEALSFTGCGTMDMLFNFQEPLFSFLKVVIFNSEAILGLNKCLSCDWHVADTGEKLVISFCSLPSLI